MYKAEKFCFKKPLKEDTKVQTGTRYIWWYSSITEIFMTTLEQVLITHKFLFCLNNITPWRNEAKILSDQKHIINFDVNVTL